MRRSFCVLLASLATTPLFVQGCGDSVEAPLALEEPVRVGYYIGATSYRAQFFPGELPEPTGGPAIAGVDVGPSEVTPGKQGKGGYTVRVAKDAYAVAIRLEGRNSGYWIARVDQVEALYADQVSASLSFDVAANVEPRTYQLEFAGVSVDRRFGARATAPLRVDSRVPTNAPAVIKLRWDAPVDLDLQLRAPDGTFLDPKHPLSAPIGAEDAGAPDGAGELDVDSLASCVDDAIREENIVFRTPPTPGKYKIYVNAFDLCRKLGTNYEVSILRNGNVEQRFFGRISEPEVQRGGFGLGDFVTDVTF